MIAARPLVDADLPAVLDLLHAYDRRWFGVPLLTLEDVRAEWSAPAFDLALDSEGWEEDDALVAFGTLGTRAEIEIAVRDDWAGAGLEDALLDRWEAEARRRAFNAVHRHLPAADVAGRALLEARGWAVLRTGWMLQLAAGTPVPRVALPAGYRVRPMQEADAPAVHAVIDAAFATYGPRRSYADWRTGTIDRPEVTVGHGHVATWRGEVVGACLVIDPAGSAGPGAQEAWVPQLAVADEHRRRGLARELLSRTALAARGRGLPELALYTHSDSGALELYQGFGMVVQHTLVECSLTL